VSATTKEEAARGTKASHKLTSLRVECSMEWGGSKRPRLEGSKRRMVQWWVEKQA